MNWEYERYVKVYTRDTPDWRALGWEARSVFYELMRKVDRAGMVPLGKSGLRGLAALLDFPLEVLERAVPRLTDDGCVVVAAGAVYLPNYTAAQEARQSDRTRQAASRERQRSKAEDNKPNNIGVGMSHAVTGGHTESPAVTSCHPILAIPAQPSLATPPVGEPAPAAPSSAPRARKPKDPARNPAAEGPREVAFRVWRATYAASRRGYGPYVDGLGDGKRMQAIGDHAAKVCADAGRPPGDIETLLAHWFREYLRDAGSKTFSLVDQRHALQFFERGIPTYGAPWSRKQAPAPKPAEPATKPENLVPPPPGFMVELSAAMRGIGGGAT